MVGFEPGPEDSHGHDPSPFIRSPDRR